MGSDERDQMLHEMDGKHNFECREGIYKLVSYQDYSLRTSYYASIPGTSPNIPVKLTYSNGSSHLPSTCQESSSQSLIAEKLCCNLGKELYIYDVLRVPSNQLLEQVIPIDKRLYKQTYPTCHDFFTGPSHPPKDNTNEVLTLNGLSSPTTIAKEAPSVASHVSGNGEPHFSKSNSPNEPISSSGQNSFTSNSRSTTNSHRLLVGFTGGQILLNDLSNKELTKLLNEEQLVDKSRVTCIRWVPTTSLHRSQQQFLVSHASGYLYLYSEHLPSGGTPPTYQLFKQGPPGSGYTVHMCKTKSTRNPLYRWQFGNHLPLIQDPFLFNHNSLLTSPPDTRFASPVSDMNGEGDSPSTTDYASYSGESMLSQRSGTLPASIVNHVGNNVTHAESASGSSSATTTSTAFQDMLNSKLNLSVALPASIHQFAFSPCGQMLAVVTQDGYLRVFDYHQMDILGQMRSYFGALLCVAWSPDSALVAVGGQDDLVTVWSVRESSVVCRCQAHRSWVSAVAFDPLNCYTGATPGTSGSPEVREIRSFSASSKSSFNEGSNVRLSGYMGRCYRLGSVGQDTQFCLWEITEDEIRQGLRFSLLQHQQQQESLSQSLSSTHTLPHTLTSSPHSKFHHSSSHSKKANNTLPHRHSSVLSASSLLSNSFTQKLFRFSPPTSFSPSSNSVALTTGNHSSSTLGRSIVDRLTYHNATHKGSNVSLHSVASDSETKLLGTRVCPRLEDIPILSPIVCKQISRDRLTDLVFRRDTIVVACQQGLVYTWARPSLFTN